MNIRTGPGPSYGVLDESPLPPDTKVEILDESHHTWKLVDVMDQIHGVSGIQGWVHGAYLREA